MFKLNPDVDDLPDRFSVDVGGVKLLVLGTVELGGKGCMCPEGAVLKALMQHLLLRLSCACDSGYGGGPGTHGSGFGATASMRCWRSWSLG